MSEQSQCFSQCLPVSPPQHLRRVEAILFLLAPMGLACFGHLIAVKVGRRLTTVCRRYTLGHWGPLSAVVTSSQGLILSVVPVAFIVRRITETVGSRLIKG